MKIEGNGTCPPANEISAALCRNANYRSDKNSVVANCVEGEDLEKLAEHVKGWEKQGFKEKESIMVSAYGAITKTSDDWSHKVQLANYQLRSKDEAGATTTLNAVATGCEDKAVLTKAAKLAGKAGLDELKTSLTMKAIRLDAIE
jgi:hypothetical protein